MHCGDAGHASWTPLSHKQRYVIPRRLSRTLINAGLRAVTEQPIRHERPHSPPQLTARTCCIRRQCLGPRTGARSSRFSCSIRGPSVQGSSRRTNTPSSGECVDVLERKTGVRERFPQGQQREPGFGWPGADILRGGKFLHSTWSRLKPPLLSNTVTVSASGLHS